MTDDVAAHIAALAAADPAQRAAAAEELSRLGPRARSAAVPLVGLSADEDETVREWAVAALEELGAPSADDIEELVALLGEVGDDRADVGYWAATLLGRMRAAAAPAVPALAASLEGDHPISVRQRAAWALGQVGSAAAAALSVLERAAGESDPRLSRLASRAIAQIRG